MGHSKIGWGTVDNDNVVLCLRKLHARFQTSGSLPEQVPVRSGITLVYTMVMLIMLLGFVSFAIDWAQVQLVKTQVYRAADAAARYAARGAADGTAGNKAISIAAANKADETSVVLQSSDVISGNYNPHLSPTFSTARTPYNAVLVTALRTKARSNAKNLTFGSVIGQNTCDIKATSMAYYGPPLKALLVVGSLPLNSPDQLVYDHVYNLGYLVTAKDQATATVADATGMGVVIISETVSSSVILGRYRDVTVPVLFYEPLIFDKMQLNGPTFGTDFGFDVSSQSVTIQSPSHDIAAGFTGNIFILNSAATYNWAVAQSGGVAIAYVPGTTHAAILAYDTGSLMYGMTAPNRRVTWFCNSYCQANQMTTEGWKMFDAAVIWAAAGATKVCYGIK